MTTGPASPESNPADIHALLTRPPVEAGPVSLGLGAVPVRPVGTPTGPLRPTAPPSPQARLAVVVLAVCGALSFPLYRNGASARVYGLALAVSVLCVFLALVLAVRSTAPVLAAAVVVPAAVAAGQLFEGTLVHSAGLSRALDLALAPSWLAGTAGVVASLTALASLVARLTWQSPRGTTARPTSDASRSAD
ncbi:hypothetical protein ABZ027_24755 [Streptomyces sp. NPDC006332]|uniref:hypothetical protein n=1 Tax=Streptomyces sp. NPDC006332 TaxID=3155456 RepID=UPI0033B83F11